MRSKWFLVGSFTLLSQAAYAQTFVVGSWNGGVQYDDTGRFSHCSVAASYVSGITLAFGVTREFAFRMVAGHEAWQMPVGSKYELVYQIDNYRPLHETAEAATNNVVIVTFVNAEELFDWLRKGHVLTIYNQGQSYVFNLKDSYRALTAVLDCVTDQIYLETARSNRANPFDTQSSHIATNGPPAKKLTAEQQTDITVFTSNLLRAPPLSARPFGSGRTAPSSRCAAALRITAWVSLSLVIG